MLIVLKRSGRDLDGEKGPRPDPRRSSDGSHVPGVRFRWRARRRTLLGWWCHQPDLRPISWKRVTLKFWNVQRRKLQSWKSIFCDWFEIFSLKNTFRIFKVINFFGNVYCYFFILHCFGEINFLSQCFKSLCSITIVFDQSKWCILCPW